MTEVECYNVKCRHRWDYKGGSKDRITCPKCLYKLRLYKAKLGYLPTLPTRLPNLPTQSFVRVSFSDDFDCLVQKSIAKQFKEAPEEYDDLEGVQEEDVEDCITIIKAPEIKIIPMKTPLEILEHHRSFM